MDSDNQDDSSMSSSSSSSLSSTSRDEEEEEEFDEFLFLLMLLELKRKRKPYWEHTRLDWGRHVEMLLHQNRFHIRYRMPLEDFSKLVEYLRPAIEPNWMQSYRRCRSPIVSEIIVAAGIRYLANGSYDDIMNCYGFGKSTFYYIRNKFLEALLSCSVLQIKIPRTEQEWEDIRSGFAMKSTCHVFRGCNGAIDGFFQPIRCPAMWESHNNPLSYYSGHYNMTGLNCQGIADCNLRFWFFGVVATGQTNDARAFMLAGLEDLVENFPIRSYLVGDGAYILTDRLIVPFMGTEKSEPKKDAFNFYLSQIRIRVEMAFGLLTTKWRILRKKIETSLDMASMVISCCAILHNYCINQNLERGEGKNIDTTQFNTTYRGRNEVQQMDGAPHGLGYLPNPNEVDDIGRVPGTSFIREIILRKIDQLKLKRPTRNRVTFLETHNH